MKTLINYNITGVLLLFIALNSGCDEYLDQTPDAVLTEYDIFGTYQAAQDFVDKQYAHIFEATFHGQGSFIGYGDDFYAFRAGVNYMARDYYDRMTAKGDYWSAFFWTRKMFANFNPIQSSEKAGGIWPVSWVMIRDANQVIKQLDKGIMSDATQEERDLIRGQALFFRAYQYWLLVRVWGGMPYIDKFMEANDDPYLPRLNTHQTIEKIVADLDKAAVLLPDNWNNTSVGRLTPDINLGRITRGACIALKSKALLAAGSPTFVLESTGTLQYDANYMKRAAEAAWEVIKLADAGVYSLTPWGAEYYRQFARNDGFNVWSSETILGCINYAKGTFAGTGQGFFEQRHDANLSPKRFGRQDITACVTQNMVEMYEMANGLPIDDPESGYNPMDPWTNRDPRFRGTILVDGDEWTFLDPEINRLDMYVGGKDFTVEFQSPFILKKYWPKGVNVYDKQWTLYNAMNPNIRLAEIYLVYAEAVNEISGPLGTVAGSSLTAVDAVDIIRARVGMPSVNTKFTGNKDAFRERIWNERAVELLGEDGARWYDLRRWHVAHLDKYKEVFKVEFDQNYTYFNRLLITTKIHDIKHYWCPINLAATQVYSGFYQNPGW